MRLRLILGIFGGCAALLFAVFTFIAVDSAGRISKQEFAYLAFAFGAVQLLITIWAMRRGDQEDEQDQKPAAPLD